MSGRMVSMLEFSTFFSKKFEVMKLETKYRPSSIVIMYNNPFANPMCTIQTALAKASAQTP